MEQALLGGVQQWHRRQWAEMYAHKITHEHEEELSCMDDQALIPRTRITEYHNLLNCKGPIRSTDPILSLAQDFPAISPCS